MKLLVQKFLETHTFKELELTHGVAVSFSKSGHKWSLNYDLLSKDDDLLAQECRGLILSCEDGRSLLSRSVEVNGRLKYDDICPGKTKVIAFPFKRFFNFGQSAAAPINFTDADLHLVASTKLDGTLCIVGYDPFTVKWFVATRSSPEADIIMDNGIHTFRSLFEKALDETMDFSFDDFTKFLDKNLTYCFELTTPYNRIVVDYKSCGLTLLGVRDLQSLKEVDITKNALVQNANFPIVDSFSFHNTQALIEWVNLLDPMKQEGVVVKDSNFNRVKIKSQAYITCHRAKDNVSSSIRNCLEVILLEKDDDLMPFLPEDIASNLTKMKHEFQNFIREYDKYYQIILNCANVINKGDRKTFALLITSNEKLLWSSPFFQIFNGKASSMKDFIYKNCKDGSWSNSFLDKLLEIMKP